MLTIPAAGAGWTVKVLDFGLASRSPTRNQIAGTLAYMAPELLLGRRASVASDLYAVAMVAAEILLGVHPFGDKQRDEDLLEKILNVSPDLSGISSPKLAQVLARALDKAPAKRPADAETFMRELAEAAQVPLPPEPAAVRESYLVAAPFTGREVELGRLIGALNRARFGQGSGWLLLGESGVGKSRLVEELRSLALINTVLVARGQAVAASGAYQLWREALRLLCLTVELTDLEASVLGTLLPDLGLLLEREVKPPPELDAQAAQARLLRVVTDLVVRQSSPVLLLLDDLQWADAESLALLRQVTRSIAARRLMVVACARADEAPQLAAELPELTVLPLRRLDPARLQQLCESMLGAQGRDAALLGLINRETEGNTFFVVEVLRALAEESGSLDGIMHRSLPARVLTGGVQQVLRRRLARVGAAAQPLLRLAAVAGRQLDLDLLATLWPDAESLVQACSAVGVLEAQEAAWRFSHDKLREQLLSELSSEELRELHGRLADAIAARYPQDPIRTGIVAHHYQKAGRLCEAAGCYAAAGDAALVRGALFEAVNLLEQAAQLHECVSRPRLEQLRVWRGIALARYGLGRQRDIDAALRRCFALIGHPLPQGRAAVWLEVGRQAARHLRLRAGMLSRPVAMDPEERLLMQEFVEACTTAEVYLWLGPPEMVALCLMWFMNVTLEPAFERQRLQLTVVLAFFLSLTPLRHLSEHYLQTIAEGISRYPGSLAEARYLTTQATIRAERGDWRASLPWAEIAIERSRLEGDEIGLQRRLWNRIRFLLNSGDTHEILRSTQEVLRRAEDAQAPHFTTLAQEAEGLVLMWRGELARARSVLTSAYEYASQNCMPHAGVVLGGLLAACLWELGELGPAQELADQVLERLKGMQLTLSHVMFGLDALIDVYVKLGELRGQVPPQLRVALRYLARLASRTPVAEPCLERCRGRVAWLSGEPVRAIRHMQRSRDLARRLSLPRDEGLACYFLGRFAASAAGRSLTRENARTYLEAALALLTQIGAHGDAARVRKELHGAMQ